MIGYLPVEDDLQLLFELEPRGARHGCLRRDTPEEKLISQHTEAGSDRDPSPQHQNLKTAFKTRRCAVGEAGVRPRRERRLLRRRPNNPGKPDAHDALPVALLDDGVERLADVALRGLAVAVGGEDRIFLDVVEDDPCAPEGNREGRVTGT